jgi:hypothetical protein
LFELDARADGAPGWLLRIEEIPHVGWLAHIKHAASGNLVPRGPQIFRSMTEAFDAARRLAGL